jgi:hypothetical protein
MTDLTQLDAEIKEIHAEIEEHMTYDHNKLYFFRRPCPQGLETN